MSEEVSPEELRAALTNLVVDKKTLVDMLTDHPWSRINTNLDKLHNLAVKLYRTKVQYSKHFPLKMNENLSLKDLKHALADAEHNETGLWNTITSLESTLKAQYIIDPEDITYLDGCYESYANLGGRLADLRQAIKEKSAAASAAVTKEEVFEPFPSVNLRNDTAPAPELELGDPLNTTTPGSTSTSSTFPVTELNSSFNSPILDENELPFQKKRVTVTADEPLDLALYEKVKVSEEDAALKERIEKEVPPNITARASHKASNEVEEPQDKRVETDEMTTQLNPEEKDLNSKVNSAFKNQESGPSTSSTANGSNNSDNPYKASTDIGATPFKKLVPSATNVSVNNPDYGNSAEGIGQEKIRETAQKELAEREVKRAQVRETYEKKLTAEQAKYAAKQKSETGVSDNPYSDEVTTPWKNKKNWRENAYSGDKNSPMTAAEERAQEKREADLYEQNRAKEASITKERAVREKTLAAQRREEEAKISLESLRNEEDLAVLLKLAGQPLHDKEASNLVAQNTTPSQPNDETDVLKRAHDGAFGPKMDPVIGSLVSNNEHELNDHVEAFRGLVTNVLQTPWSPENNGSLYTEASNYRNNGVPPGLQSAFDDQINKLVEEYKNKAEGVNSVTHGLSDADNDGTTLDQNRATSSPEAPPTTPGSPINKPDQNEDQKNEYAKLQPAATGKEHYDAEAAEAEKARAYDEQRAQKEAVFKRKNKERQQKKHDVKQHLLAEIEPKKMDNKEAISAARVEADNYNGEIEGLMRNLDKAIEAKTEIVTKLKEAQKEWESLMISESKDPQKIKELATEIIELTQKHGSAAENYAAAVKAASKELQSIKAETMPELATHREKVNIESRIVTVALPKENDSLRTFVGSVRLVRESNRQAVKAAAEAARKESLPVQEESDELIARDLDAAVAVEDANVDDVDDADRLIGSSTDREPEIPKTKGAASQNARPAPLGFPVIGSQPEKQQQQKQEEEQNQLGTQQGPALLSAADENTADETQQQQEQNADEDQFDGFNESNSSEKDAKKLVADAVEEGKLAAADKDKIEAEQENVIDEKSAGWSALKDSIFDSNEADGRELAGQGTHARDARLDAGILDQNRGLEENGAAQAATDVRQPSNLIAAGKDEDISNHLNTEDALEETDADRVHVVTQLPVNNAVSPNNPVPQGQSATTHSPDILDAATNESANEEYMKKVKEFATPKGPVLPAQGQQQPVAASATIIGGPSSHNQNQNVSTPIVVYGAIVCPQGASNSNVKYNRNPHKVDGLDEAAFRKGGPITLQAPGGKNYDFSMKGTTPMAVLSAENHKVSTYQEQEELARTIMNMMDNVAAKGGEVNVDTADPFVAAIAQKYKEQNKYVDVNIKLNGNPVTDAVPPLANSELQNAIQAVSKEIDDLELNAGATLQQFQQTVQTHKVRMSSAGAASAALANSAAQQQSNANGPTLNMVPATNTYKAGAPPTTVIKIPARDDQPQSNPSGRQPAATDVVKQIINTPS